MWTYSPKISSYLDLTKHYLPYELIDLATDLTTRSTQENIYTEFLFDFLRYKNKNYSAILNSTGYKTQRTTFNKFLLNICSTYSFRKADIDAAINTKYHPQRSSSYLTYQETGHPIMPPSGHTGTTSFSTRASNRKQKGNKRPDNQPSDQETRRTRRRTDRGELLSSEVVSPDGAPNLSSTARPGLPLEIRHQTTPNLDFLTSERYRRGELDREERFEPEMAQKKRPKRRQKKNRGQRRKRVLWEDKRKARKSYLELKQVHEQLNLPFELETEFEVEIFWHQQWDT